MLLRGRGLGQAKTARCQGSAHLKPEVECLYSHRLPVVLLFILTGRRTAHTMTLPRVRGHCMPGVEGACECKGGLVWLAGAGDDAAVVAARAAAASALA